MARPQTKDDLIAASNENYEKLMKFVETMSAKELEVEFDFSSDEKKKENHWKRDKNLRDVLIHLYEWHKLLLEWVEANEAGESKSFLMEGYTWKTYSAMNVVFWNRNQKTTLEEAKSMLDETHKKVMKLVDKYNNEELFSKGVFKWTGGNALGSYIVSTTSSHYDWAIKKLKAHRKMIPFMI